MSKILHNNVDDETLKCRIAARYVGCIVDRACVSHHHQICTQTNGWIGTYTVPHTFQGGRRNYRRLFERDWSTKNADSASWANRCSNGCLQKYGTFDPIFLLLPKIPDDITTSCHQLLWAISLIIFTVVPHFPPRHTQTYFYRPTKTHHRRPSSTVGRSTCF